MKDSDDFFKVYSPVFFRNAKWSTEKPVPLLGDDSTPYNKVEAFYNFWMEFKSWREFTAEDDYDPETASCREERRWMERQNEKERTKKKKDENARIRRLVELAYKKDPRIARKKAADIEAKEKKKQEKIDAKRMEEEEKLRKEEEERKQKEEEERIKAEEAAQLKKQKEREKKAFKSEKKNFKMLVKAITDSLSDLKVTEVEELNDAAETLCNTMSPDELRQLNEDMALMSTNPNQFIVSLKEKYEVQKSVATKKTTPNTTPISSPATPAASVVTSPKQEPPKKSTEWSRTELSLLAQGIAKYPGGASNRWQQISDLIGTRTPEEVIEKTKSLKKGEIVRAPEVLPTDKGKPVDPEPTVRFAPESPAPSPSVPVASPPVVKEEAEKPKQAAATPSVWSAEQQKALESGLKLFNAQMTDRWDRIAEMVPGKTKKDCIARFKELREKLKASQAQVK
eukprot:TRINITY_DN7115_c0_g2_i1.p1 TRINITY_DN7115_c0_g2~~TRINITY_DN7115_c0_g2_i1.p1  ORF type:complete len:454 (+),score=142.02 TRINITY_DN7115_c0_g2_i1:617-1978(+)